MATNFSVIDDLDFSLGVCDLDHNDQQSPVKRHYVRQAELFLFDIDKIYFSGEYPSVYFKSVTDFSTEIEKSILKIQKSIWNQGKVPFLYVESPTEIRIFNCYEKPVFDRDKDRTIKDITLFSASKQIERDLEELKTVFDKISIDTGSFWKQSKYAEKVKYEKRVEQALVDNLRKTRQKLESTGLDLEIIHDLLLRSLFLLYLEDRGATDTIVYEGAASYFDILEDKAATYTLFGKLETSFNGNLCPIHEAEKEQVTSAHLKLIRECFWSPIRESGQLQLFAWARIFDFSIIPIELISSIYEDFLAKENGEDKQAQSGAYYTPRPLAEFILNHVLPYPSVSDSRFNVKILDPTCGSGMFLVESLNRLLDRWEFENYPKKLDFDTIQQLVLDNIYGVEKEKEALKVAAFSIYLAMLNRLDPKNLWHSQQFPYLIFEPDNADAQKQGKNLFRMSSIGKGGFEAVEYDLVVGNPPFKRGGLDNEIRDYLDKYGFAQEMVLAFLHRATILCPNGKIAMIFAAKILFNTEKPYQRFREFFFNDNYVEQVYNFSILRRIPKSEGTNLFESATNPTGILIYSKRFPQKQEDKIIYCAPKSVIKNRFIDGIAIDTTDIKYLPRVECQKPDTKIWKIAMWGTERDFYLFNKFKNANTLGGYLKSLEKPNLLIGTGLHKPDKGDVSNTFQIANLPLVPTKKIQRYYTETFAFDKVGVADYREIDSQLFKSPLVLIKEGLKNKRFCTSILLTDTAFLNAVYGISNIDIITAKEITAYLNSKIATYFLFFISSTWGIERERVKLNEVLDLPELPNQEYDSQVIIEYVDKIIDTLSSNQVSLSISNFESMIESEVSKKFNFSNLEQILVNDFVDYTLDSFLEPNSRAYFPVNRQDLTPYASLVSNTINNFLKFGSSLSAWATVFELSPKTPLSMVAIHLNETQEASYIAETNASINEVLKEIEAYTYQKYAESIYYRKFIRYYKNDTIYIIKPNEKRFWSRSLALNDADEIILEITSIDTHGRVL